MTTIFVTANEYLGTKWPAFLPTPPDPTVLDHIWIEPPESSVAEGQARLVSRLLFEQELVLALPGLNAVGLVVAPSSTQSSGTEIAFEIDFAPQTSLRIIDTPIALRFSSDLLRPMRALTDGANTRYEPDPGRSFVQFTMAKLTASASKDGISFATPFTAQIPHPVMIADTGIVIDSGQMAFHREGGKTCLALTWNEANLNALLGQFIPNLGDRSTPGDRQITLRIILDDGIAEIRLDWDTGPARDAFALPGLTVTMPESSRYSLLLTRQNGALNRAAFIVTLAANKPVMAGSTFAWGRDGDRELHNDEPPAEKPFFSVTLASPEQRSVVLLDTTVGALKLPGFFHQLAAPLAPLDTNDPAALCTPVDFVPVELQGNWNATLTVNVGTSNNAFTLPFLKQNQSNAAQFLQIYTLTPLTDLPITLPQGEVTFGVGVRLQIISLTFDFVCSLTFNLSTFALKVDHDQGIDLRSTKIEYQFPDLFGMQWRFKGKPLGDGSFHYFTIATKNYNYQIQQPEGAVLELDFTRASEEPITFSVRDFALTPKGVNLTATVTDRPARLNGLRTRFRFTDSGFVIRENRIADFTIAGSGPLPPDLVGDATADIALQFAQRDGGNLTLVQGAANLRGTKLLDCKGTRFQFSVDAIGLKFVDDGKFHLYFTLTGAAQFVQAPGDDANGPLALLGKIRIDLVQCPLTGDASVIAKHVKFLIELPKPKSFNFLGCFEMELRAIGFVPQCEFFDGDGAMQITGQLKFAQGPGDTPDSRPDYHELFIGLPEPGAFLPRIHFAHLAVNLALGSAFRLSGVVDFIDKTDETGLIGEGLIEIQGLPTIAASFGFLRVRRNATSPWLRAWFLYLEIRQVSFMIPVIQIYLREIGMGFGYRFTIASIKAADAEKDIRKLLKTLQELSRTQGDLSKRDRWAVDLEAQGQDPRWTIVLRAMISQTSASASPLRYEAFAESEIACVFLVDAIIAFRSDLTFFMAVRGWFNTNYADYVKNANGERENPILSGFVLLSPRQKRFLAHVYKPEGGKPGMHPPLPDFVRDAIGNSRFSATLLIEPGLFHYELGWPNMLRWHAELGPLAVEIEGGFIFRISTTELVLGSSFLARGKLDLSAGLDLGLVGVRITAQARVAYGARYIGVIDFRNPKDNSAIYGAIGLEVQIAFSIEFWIKIPLVFTTIKLSFSFSLEIQFSASLEVGVKGLSLPGVRGMGTVGVSCCGHSLQVTVKVAFNEENVQAALDRTKEFLSLGLEATDVEPVPGTAGGTLSAEPQFLRAVTPLRTALPPRAMAVLLAPHALVLGEGDVFHVPGYIIFVLRDPPDWDEEERFYFVLLPQAERLQRDNQGELVLDEEGFPIATLERGFLPPPPVDTVAADFALHIPQPDAAENYQLFHFEPLNGNDFVDVSTNVAAGDPILWGVHWDAALYQAEKREIDESTRRPKTDTPSQETLTLRQHLANAFKQSYAGVGEATVVSIVGDPDPLPDYRPLVSDPRVQNPSDSAFEAAVRGAFEQFRGSPFFKKDPGELYEQLLTSAFDPNTTIYAPGGTAPQDDDPGVVSADQASQQAHQLRGIIIHDLISDLRAFHATSVKSERDKIIQKSVAFQMGLVFAVKSGNNQRPAWIDQVTTNAATLPTISQRETPDATAPSTTSEMVRPFNVVQTDFSAFPPQFEQVRQYSDASTIALTWDLTWRRAPTIGTSRAQDDPDHHLAHYLVRRRALDGNETEHITTVKPVKVLHRHTTLADESNPVPLPDTLALLQPRFQVVDHFAETNEDRAALPREGRSYVYTITPVDFAGNLGRPLTLIATRYPNTPPQVPVDGDMTVSYQISEADTEPVGSASTPQVLPPRQVYVEWSEPATQNGPEIPIKTYRLIFRRETTLPIGSYGLDSTTQRGRSSSLPTSNARPLPTDIVLPFERAKAFGPRGARALVIPIEMLRNTGVLPEDVWRPEAWRVFFQTISDRDVPSALAPVQLRLAVEAVATAPAGVAPDDRIEEPLAQHEERRPAELEWLPRPTSFAVVAPEDERAQPGDAHVPMPLKEIAPAAEGTPVPPFIFNNQIDRIVQFQQHPLNIRAIRFRWNQGPSGNAAYPLDLNAGYRLYELNIDAATTDTFANGKRLAEELRLLQEVQMLPSADLPLTPGDTLNTSQWEAWYPGAVQRRKPPALRATGSELTRGPWYSWQDSYLEWPAWPGVTQAGGKRTQPLHPFLAILIERMRAQRPGSTTDIFGTLIGGYTAALQLSPPTLPNNLANFLASCPPGADRYGWGALQRLGLAVTFSLHDPDIAVLRGPELLNTLQSVFDQMLDADDSDATQFAAFRRHLHVELLFQPGRSVQLDELSASGDDMLALVQLSLRPTVQQRLRYRAVFITGRSNATIDALLSVAAPCSLVNQADQAAGQSELEPQPDPSKRTIRLPLNGETSLLLRASDLPIVQVRPFVKLTKDPQPFPVELAAVLAYDAAQKQLSASGMLNAAQAETLRALLDPADADKAAALAGTVTIMDFGATDERTSYFTVATESLAQLFAAFPQTNVPERDQWLRLKYYIETLNSNDPKVPNTSKVTLPTTGAEILEILPDVLGWTARFFDASGAIAEPGQGELAQTGDGPWVATAYPRAESPAVAAPDASGRLTYTQLLEDKWAHTFRFYFQPYGRYDLLWRSLRHSFTLFPGLAFQDVDEPNVLVQPDAGGLDVVVERTQPVDAPLVLSARRLDEAATPMRPPAPGAIWEVIIAQHHEQTLVERNQTVSRQLAFRQIAFTLLRRFSYATWYYWIRSFAQGNERDLPVRLVEDSYPPIPYSYPTRPDHLDFTSALDADDARSLDLPERVGNFSQGMLALQWRALPFYYEHRLLVIAQADSKVSPVNSVTQRDLTYRSPLPQASSTGVFIAWRRQPPFPNDVPADALIQPDTRVRNITIPLRRFWDSLPDDAQQQWHSEQPDPTDSDATARKLSALPDPEVVYQIVEVFSGNIEVQAECFYDPEAQQYTHRQLGKHFLVAQTQLWPQPTVLADFPLHVALLQVSEEQLSDSYNGPINLPINTYNRVAFTEDKRFLFAGVMTKDDRAALFRMLNEQDGKKIQQLFESWYSMEPVSAAQPDLPGQLDRVIDFVPTTTLTLGWEGPSDADAAALIELPGDSAFTGAIAQIVAQAAGAAADAFTRVEIPFGPEHIPEALAQKVSFARTVDLRHYTAMNWQGAMSAEDAAALRRWALFPEFAQAAEALIAAVQGFVLTFDLPPEARRPTQADTPAELQQVLHIQPTALMYEGPKANATQMAVLQALQAQGDVAFQQGIATIIDANQAAANGTSFGTSVQLPPENLRPTNETLPQEIQEQLNIEPLTLTWKGYPATATQVQQLQTLLQQGDQPFQDAVQQSIEGLETLISVPFMVAVRPTQADLTGDLAEKLLLGTVLMRYHGIMSRDDPGTLLPVYPTRPDQRALRRLHDTTQQSGLRGRSLMIRARRGSALPSQMKVIEPDVV